MRQNTPIQRLNIIKGQIEGLIRLLEKDSQNCQKITEQFYAIEAALKKTIEIYLKENLAVCLKTVKGAHKKDVDFLIQEIIKKR
jgi:DNA-binding FrmR family transcriptional regulator